MNREHEKRELISKKEETEILASLENEFFGSSIKSENDLVFKSRKKGLFLPLIITGLSIAATMATILFLPLVTSQNRNENQSRSSRIEGNGNRIFSTYKAETEKTISVKTKQIEVYEEKISDYDSKLLYLRNLINRNVEQPDSSISEALPQYMNMSDEEIEAEISKLEAEKKTVSIEIEKTKQEILEVKTDDPFSEVARFQQIQNQESLITDQISIFYIQILEDLDNMRFGSAKDNLESLSALIESDSNSDFPSIKKRKPIDMRIISFLDTHITTLESNIDDENWMEELSSRAELYVLNGDKLAGIGKIDEAEQFYRESLKLLPYLGRAYEQLENYNNDRWQMKMDAIDIPQESIVHKEEEDQAIDPLTDEEETEIHQQMEELLPTFENQQLFGVLASVDSPIITIESFKSVIPATGTELTVRRFDSSGDEQIIATGRIIISSNEVITGEVSNLFGEGILLPAQDLIYLDINESDLY